MIRLLATALLALALMSGLAQAETLRLLTWGGYAPEKVIKLFEQKYPDIKVEVTFSNNEEMIAKLRASGGAGYDLAQPGFNRVAAAQKEFGIYKPLDLAKINAAAVDPVMLKRVQDDTTIDGRLYAFPHLWGTSGLMVDATKAGEVKRWSDLCDAKYKGRTSMRLRRSILVGMAFDMGKNPFEAYKDPAQYQKLLDEVAEKLIACKSNLKAYWKGGDDLSALMLSGEAVAAETWDSTAYKLYGQNKNIRFVAPASGALGWIDSFALPKRGAADDAAYKWINFVMEPEIVTMIAESSGAISVVKTGIALLPDATRDAVKLAFGEAEIANIKWAAQIPPGIEDLEGKVLARIQASGN